MGYIESCKRNSKGNIIFRIDTDGNMYEYEYDDHNRIIYSKITDKFGIEFYKYYDYDMDGKLIRTRVSKTMGFDDGYLEPSSYTRYI